MNTKISHRASAGILLIMALMMSMATWYTGPTSAATILPNGEQTFLDNNGNPLASGLVYFYIPSTFTPKDTWQDASGSTLNTNPVLLDDAGRAIIYGSGSYRQIVKDSLGNVIWDQLTEDTSPTTGISWGGTSGGSANTQTVVATDFVVAAGAKLVFIAGFTNTGPLTVNPNATGAISVLKPSLSAPAALSGGEVVAGNIVELDYDGAVFQLVNPVETPITGPLTNLASATTTQLGTIASHNINITGTTTITSFGSSASTAFPIYFVKFQGVLLLTYNASSLIIPGAYNITTTAGDTAVIEYLGSSNWKVRDYVYINPPWVPAPQGRLTLTTATPVMTADVTSSASVFYTPYTGNQVPLYNGTTFTPQTFTEQTLTLNNPNHVINSNWDVFAATNAGVLTICTGPAWTSDTGRGTGAGTTQISRVLGVWTNTVALSACRNGATTFAVAAGFGTYLGSFRTTGTIADTVWIATPAAASGGGNARLYVWNAYNRVNVGASSKDTTNTWTYSTATWRAANAAVSSGVLNRITAIFGLNEDSVLAAYTQNVSASGATDTMSNGVCLDCTNNFTGAPGTWIGNNNGGFITGRYNGTLSTPGLHFFQATEFHNAAGGVGTWYGDNNVPTYQQMVLELSGRM